MTTKGTRFGRIVAAGGLAVLAAVFLFGAFAVFMGQTVFVWYSAASFFVYRFGVGGIGCLVAAFQAFKVKDGEAVRRNADAPWVAVGALLLIPAVTVLLEAEPEDWAAFSGLIWFGVVCGVAGTALLALGLVFHLRRARRAGPSD